VALSNLPRHPCAVHQNKTENERLTVYTTSRCCAADRPANFVAMPRTSGQATLAVKSRRASAEGVAATRAPTNSTALAAATSTRGPRNRSGGAATAPAGRVKRAAAAAATAPSASFGAGAAVSSAPARRPGLIAPGFREVAAGKRAFKGLCAADDAGVAEGFGSNVQMLERDVAYLLERFPGSCISCAGGGLGCNTGWACCGPVHSASLGGAGRRCSECLSYSS
jgi:hypothetical protein